MAMKSTQSEQVEQASTHTHTHYQSLIDEIDKVKSKHSVEKEGRWKSPFPQFVFCLIRRCVASACTAVFSYKFIRFPADCFPARLQF